MSDGDDARVGDYRDRFYAQYGSTQIGVDVEEGTMAIGFRSDIVPLVSGPRVLDLGCGQGVLVRELAAQGKEAMGIETSPQMAAMARARGTVVEEAEAIHFLKEHPQAFDSIVATDLIEHFDPDQVVELFDAVRGALRDGGEFVGRTPNGASPFAGRYRYGDFTHGTSFTEQSIGQIAGVTGFDRVLVRGCEPVPHGPVSFSRRAIWRAFQWFYRLSLAAETGVPPKRHVVTQNLVFKMRRAG